MTPSPWPRSLQATSCVSPRNTTYAFSNRICSGRLCMCAPLLNLNVGVGLLLLSWPSYTWLAIWDRPYYDRGNRSNAPSLLHRFVGLCLPFLPALAHPLVRADLAEFPQDVPKASVPSLPCASLLCANTPKRGKRMKLHSRILPDFIIA